MATPTGRSRVAAQTNASTVGAGPLSESGIEINNLPDSFCHQRRPAYASYWRQQGLAQFGNACRTHRSAS